MIKDTMSWDFAVGMVATLFGLVFGYVTYNMPRASFGDPMGPLYFPFGIAILSVFIGIILMIRSNPIASVSAFKDLINEDRDNKRNRKKVLLTCILCVGYALIFEPLGYIISTIFFLFGILCTTNGLKAWKTNVIVAVLFAVIIYFIFSTLLSISLPQLPFLED